ncbi:Polyribonucleotide nucleotidyltransferase (polynucleotide phosphorylase), partial [Reticulomyxa filosa]
SLCTTTLGPPNLARKRNVNVYNYEYDLQRLYFEYDMPPYATHEIKNVTKSRRAQGHGALAGKALEPLLPGFDTFAFSVRVASNISSSDGSSSMASVCGGSLALMDAGVPMSNAAAGISMGLVTKKVTNQLKTSIADYRLLTDVLGLEDQFGDMDFKIAGTIKGITAVQMDIKLPGVPLDILIQAVDIARKARLHILETMNQAIEKSRPELKNHAPKIALRKLEPRDFALLLGPGGQTKRLIEIQSRCDLEVNFDNSIVEITAPDNDGLFFFKKKKKNFYYTLCQYAHNNIYLYSFGKGKSLITDAISLGIRVGDV